MRYSTGRWYNFRLTLACWGFGAFVILVAIFIGLPSAICDAIRERTKKHP